MTRCRAPIWRRCMAATILVLSGCNASTGSHSGSALVPLTTGSQSSAIRVRRTTMDDSSNLRSRGLPDRRSLWSVETSPSVLNSDGLYDDPLYGVSGLSTKDAWAVGYTCCVANGSQEYDDLLIEHWDGNAWTIASRSPGEPADSQSAGSRKFHQETFGR